MNDYLMCSDLDQLLTKRRRNKMKVPVEKKKRMQFDPTLPVKYKSYLKRAINKDMEFSLTVDEFSRYLGKPCEYCGDVSDTIDRLDSSKGYTPNNCVPSCLMCNIMKMTSLKEDFLEKVRQIYNYNDLGKRKQADLHQLVSN